MGVREAGRQNGSKEGRLITGAWRRRLRKWIRTRTTERTREWAARWFGSICLSLSLVSLSMGLWREPNSSPSLDSSSVRFTFFVRWKEEGKAQGRSDFVSSRLINCELTQDIVAVDVWCVIKNQRGSFGPPKAQKRCRRMRNSWI